MLWGKWLCACSVNNNFPRTCVGHCLPIVWGAFLTVSINPHFSSPSPGKSFPETCPGKTFLAGPRNLVLFRDTQESPQKRERCWPCLRVRPLALPSSILSERLIIKRLHCELSIPPASHCFPDCMSICLVELPPSNLSNDLLACVLLDHIPFSLHFVSPNCAICLFGQVFHSHACHS